MTRGANNRPDTPATRRAQNLPKCVEATNRLIMKCVQPNAGDLRIALFSGNYNYVRDGANQALNNLVGYALSQGAAVRVYSPTVAEPAFAPTGDLVSVPALSFPGGREEYKFSRGLPASVRADIMNFAPNCFHVAAPDVLGHRAVTMARAAGIPVIATVHTLFETYPAYYGMGFMERPLVAILRRFYNRCDMVSAPSQVIEDRLRAQGVVRPISRWARGTDHDRFSPARRDLPWRQSLGIGDEEVVVGFLGRLVLEKGLDIFASVAAELSARGIAHRIMVIGDGPAKDEFQRMVPTAVMAGFLTGNDLGKALASCDILLNPSVTECFGNVNLEAMAAGVVVVAADATGNQALVQDGVTGRLISPRNVDAYADAIQIFAQDRQLLRATGQAAHRFAADFEWGRINQMMLDAYSAMIAQKGER